MKKEIIERIDKEITEYQTALTYDAKICDWQMFEEKAGRLFDYLETLEFSTLRKKFYDVFRMVLIVLLVAGSALWVATRDTVSILSGYQRPLFLAVLACGLFAAIFFFDFKLIMNFKASHRGKRRAHFVEDIENSFRSEIGTAGCAGAG